MPDAQHCLAMADEAERLSVIVSYGRDKTRLRQQAEHWREQALAMTPLPDPPVSDAKSSAHGLFGWLRRKRA